MHSWTEPYCKVLLITLMRKDCECERVQHMITHYPDVNEKYSWEHGTAFHYT